MIAPPRCLAPDDTVAGFDCGHESFDRWLTRRARPSERQRTAVTYVAADADRLVGYYCLSAHSVARASVGGGWLASNAPGPIPAFLLGRLAADRSWQGRGLGWSLLRDAVVRAAEASAVLGGPRPRGRPDRRRRGRLLPPLRLPPFPGLPGRLYLPTGSAA
ncbi:MAG: GNAT family N-acetyltransferase [Propionibacteriaceae bacterium]|nr:GNAT family N-acetyltransferase [Propionibacteriaceae bacterium]